MYISWDILFFIHLIGAAFLIIIAGQYYKQYERGYKRGKQDLYERHYEQRDWAYDRFRRQSPLVWEIKETIEQQIIDDVRPQYWFDQRDATIYWMGDGMTTI